MTDAPLETFIRGDIEVTGIVPLLKAEFCPACLWVPRLATGRSHG
jgi:hypothetical protein